MKKIIDINQEVNGIKNKKNNVRKMKNNEL